MKNKTSPLTRFLQDQKGQSVMEYIILATLIGATAIAAVNVLGNKITQRVRALETKIEQEVVIKE